MLLGLAVVATLIGLVEPKTEAIIYKNDTPIETPSEAPQATTSEVMAEKVQTPTETQNKLCSPQCVAYVRTKIPELPRMISPNYQDNNNRPSRGCAVFFDYDHIAYIEGLFAGGMWVSETNRDGKCSYAERLVEWSDPHIEGFWCPE